MKNICNKIGLVAMTTGCFVLLSCVSNVLTGQTVKETRNVKGFSGVSLSFSGDVFINQGSSYKVEVEADKGSIDEILTQVDGNTLVLKTRPGYWRNLGKVNVYITMPEVKKLRISGSGDIICESTIRTDEIDLAVSGSGSIKLAQLEARGIEAEITGSGNIAVSAGNGNNNSELNATITGSGDFRAEGIAVGEAKVRITGSGSARVNVLKELETNITGSGSVYYKGNPLVNANATGSGRTRAIN